MLQITTIPALRDNYIWGLHRDGEAAVVDPGEAGPVQEWLGRTGLRLRAILITHHHADHQGGVAELLERAPGIAVFGPGAESITGLNRPLAGGETFVCLGTEFQVLSLPGHTRGHLAYRAGTALFCGDVLFGAGCGRIFEGTPAQMFAALAQIAALPDETQIFCAHEYTLLNLPFAARVEPDNPAIAARLTATLALRAEGRPSVPSTLALEKASNPFLRTAEPGVRAAAQRRDPRADTPEQVFAVLRAWRDEF